MSVDRSVLPDSARFDGRFGVAIIGRPVRAVIELSLLARHRDSALPICAVLVRWPAGICRIWAGPSLGFLTHRVPRDGGKSMTAVRTLPDGGGY
jgi:hypothetical protein